MPADDERDPLDHWLDRQVRPLPPPPGTFELITRKARRRKVRKAVVTLVSGVAVAAAVAVAVPGGLLLKVGPSQVPATSLANGGTRTQGAGTQSPNGTASRVSPSVSAGSTGPSAAGTEPSGPVPANFAPTSVTFVSPAIAWVIGQAGTPGKCANKKNPYICTSVARTDDGGKTWEGGPAPGTTGPNGAAGVSAIRYLDGVNGWAFGPELWVTHDAGNNWEKVPTSGYRVTDLETAGDRAFALWALCPDSAPAVASGCTSYTLMSTAKNSDAWAPVGGLTSGLADQGNPTSAVLQLTGTMGYLLAPDGTLYEGPVSGGAWRKAGTAPCQPGAAQADGLPSHAFLALQNAENLAIACSGSSVAGSSVSGSSVSGSSGSGGVQVSTSSDSGQLWTDESASAWSGITNLGTPTSLAATSGGELILATTTGIYLRPGTGQWTATSATGTAAPAGGFTYVGMTTPSQGVAVPADTGLHEIYLTYDGGTTWTPSTPVEPGR